jgi:hypothetical protein
MLIEEPGFDIKVLTQQEILEYTDKEYESEYYVKYDCCDHMAIKYERGPDGNYKQYILDEKSDKKIFMSDIHHDALIMKLWRHAKYETCKVLITI